MKKIFVSRALSEDSPIIKAAESYEIQAQSLIEFAPLSFQLAESDWVFFYSRNGVKYFFENGPYELYPFRWACMSNGTADSLSQYVQDISFVGDGNPISTSKAFGELVKENEIICFIRAENSMDSINEQLSRSQDNSIIVYSNTISKNVPLDDFDILIFTSPMNVEAYYSIRKPQNEQVIAIGNTTAAKLSELQISDVSISKSPSEDGIAEILTHILKIIK